jgi:DNA polymerase-3 subunit alpha
MVHPFVSLHHHATNSYGDGFRTPFDHVKVAAELGYPAMALTDHGNVSGHVKLEKATKEAGIKPIFGCEVYCETKDERGQLKNHLTVLAMDQTGYQNLNRLVSASWDNFRYKPTVTSEMLVKYNEGLVVLSGCLGGLLACTMLGGKDIPEKSRPDLRAAEKVAGWFAEVFQDRYYLEVMPHPQLDQQITYNASLAELGNRMDLPLVATLDCHYPLLSDKDMYPVLHAIARGGRHNTVEGQSQSWEYDINLCPRPAVDIHRDLVRAGLTRFAATHAMDSTLEIADRCNVEIPKFEVLKYPGDKPSEELFMEWCRRGWEYRRLNSLRGKEFDRYVERVKYETKLIIEKGFVDYFLVISELVRWAKNNGIAVGPARGSAAASLVCYLLRITEVNPMLYSSLLFERFIDPNRHDLPDVDLDFDDERRSEVRQHLVDQYGADRVGNIGTFTQYRGKNSLDDIARVYRVPLGEVEALKEMLVERSVGDLRGIFTTISDSERLFPRFAAIMNKYPDLHKAKELEGNLKGFSVHAAGLVVANEPLTNGVATYTQPDARNGGAMRNVLSIDKDDAEWINALKIDALGLTTMGATSRCLKMIGMSVEELYAIPLDEEEVFEAFRRGEVVGVFQFDGRAMRGVNREVKPDNFAEICDINALSRPGPLHSGAAALYIEVKHGHRPAEHFHPVIDEITQHTNYQIVYQEQILQTVRRLANFSWEQAAQIRRLISKKKGEAAFNQMQQLFMDGAAENGVKPIAAGKIWRQLVTAGAYAFNAAHCVSYGMLAYWTMWLKVHHPLEFYCSGLQKYDPKTKGGELLKEATAKGIKILPPDPTRSQLTWSISDGALLAGLTQISGIGEKTAKDMIGFRESLHRIDNRLFDKDVPLKWSDFAAVKGIGPKTMEKVEEFCSSDDPFEVNLLTNRLRAARGWLNRRAESEMMRRPTSRSEDVPYEPKMGEHVVLLAVRDRNTKDIYEMHRSRKGEELDPSTVKQPEYVNYVVMTCEDELGPLVVTVHRFDGLYEKYKDIIWSMDTKKHLLLVEGFKRREYRRGLYVKRLWVIDPDKLKG